MDWIISHLLSTVIFLPLCGALLLLCIPARLEQLIKALSLVISLIAFVLALKMYLLLPGTGDFEFVELASWIPSLGISYRIGVDGTSAMLMLLSAFLVPITILGAWNDISSRVKTFHVFMLILASGMLGVFAALDVFLFYVFWEIVLIPMYFMIGIWGSGARIRAALKFVIYTMVGSVLMLAAILYVAAKLGGTFNLIDWYAGSFSHQEQMWLFAAFALAFAIKVPLFPLHTWLPDAHTEAPTAGSVILAGVLLKLGTYGFYRFAMPLFPDALLAFQPLFLTLAVIGIVYSALVALVQPDLKRLVAYSSVSHLGFVMLGLFSLNAAAVQGAVLQMVNHGLSTGGLFLLIGMLYSRRHTRLIAEYGGLSRSVPYLAVAFIFMSLASVGMPGLNGFVGEFLILLGTFQTKMPYAAVAVSGVVLAAAYMLWAIQRVFFGPLEKEENKSLRDMTFREYLVLLPLVALIFAIGVWPKPWLKKLEPSTRSFMTLVGRAESLNTPVVADDDVSLAQGVEEDGLHSSP